MPGLDGRELDRLLQYMQSNKSTMGGNPISGRDMHRFFRHFIFARCVSKVVRSRSGASLGAAMRMFAHAATPEPVLGEIRRSEFVNITRDLVC